jgi:hypothetical protein
MTAILAWLVRWWRWALGALGGLAFAAAQVWHGRMSEGGMLHLVELALGSVGIYCAGNVLENVLGPLGGLLARKP